jgi:hypothetical protein
VDASSFAGQFRQRTGPAPLAYPFSQSLSGCDFNKNIRGAND